MGRRPASDFEKFPLHGAAFSGAVDTVRELMMRGADVNAQDALGRTALHYACEHQHLETVQALVKAGARVDLRDGYGNISLWHAVFWFKGGDPSLMLSLLRAGADFDSKNHTDRSPRDMAKTNMWPGMAEVLMEFPN